jgi:hypothetical protein
MIDSFIAYIERLELLTFFSGYPIVYAFVLVFTGKEQKKGSLMESFRRSLPMAYALVGTFFLLLGFREIYVQMSIKNFEPGLNLTPLRIWGFLSIIFWIPLFRRKPIYSLLHSLIFFYLICRDIVMGIMSAWGNDIIANDMKVYTISILLNLISLIIVSIASFLVYKNVPRH